MSVCVAVCHDASYRGLSFCLLLGFFHILIPSLSLLVFIYVSHVALDVQGKVNEGHVSGRRFVDVDRRRTSYYEGTKRKVFVNNVKREK